ncbi:MAG: STAS domain-containing protein, partial [Bacteroidota bacterium]
GFKIIDVKGLKHLLKVPRADAAVLVLVLLLTTFGSLIQAVGVGVALACLLFMKKAGDLSEQGLEVGPVADLDGTKPWQDEVEFYEAYKDKVIIKHLYGPLFFGFTAFFKDGVNDLPDNIKALIIRMDRVPYIDQSGLYALEDVILSLRQQDIEVIFTGLHEQPRDMLEAVEIIPDLVPESDLFAEVDDSFTYLKQKWSAS